MIRRAFILITIIPLLSIFVSGQEARPGMKPPVSGNRDSSNQEIDLPDEMRSRLIIARLENEHKKFLEDVNKLDELSGEISRSFSERRSLSPADMEKLESIEKLAKRILSHAGGNQVDDKKGVSAKMKPAEAIDQMSEAVASIKKSVISETRHVVSATVIGNSNEVIDLSRTIRRFYKKKN